MDGPSHSKRAGSVQYFHTDVIAEKTAHQRFKELLEVEHDLGERPPPKGRSH